jgi:hypothetical protein
MSTITDSHDSDYESDSDEEKETKVNSKEDIRRKGSSDSDSDYKPTQKKPKFSSDRRGAGEDSDEDNEKISNEPEEEEVIATKPRVIDRYVLNIKEEEEEEENETSDNESNIFSHSVIDERDKEISELSRDRKQEDVEIADDFSEAGTEHDDNKHFPAECYFAYLIVNFDKNKKIHTYIGKSRDPIAKCQYWNRRELRGRKRDRDTPAEQKKPCWNIELIIGPFSSRDKARDFKETWKLKSRGIKPRRLRGMQLAYELKKTVYDVRKPMKSD